MAIDWDEVRRSFSSSDDAPADWPPGVKPISFKGMALLGVHPTRNQIFWDGQELVTEKRLATFERVMAFVVTLATAILAAIEVCRAAGWIIN